MWLSLPYLYFDGEALAWFNWLYHNKQFYDWKHFTDRLFYHYHTQTVMEFGLPPVTDLLLQMDVNLSQEVVEQEIVSALDKDNSNPKVSHTMLEPHVANSMVLSEQLNSRGSSSTSIHFPSGVISFGCIETLGPMLDSKNDLKDDPINYACKMFAEMPNKKIDMKVEHPVINDSENLASHIFDEMFQTVSTIKGEYNDLVMVNMQLGLGISRCSNAMSGMLSTCTYVQLINRGITDHFSRLGRASLILTLQLFTPDQCGFTFPFDPGSRLLTMFLRVTRNSVFCVSSNDSDHDKLIMSTFWNSCILVDNILKQNLPCFLSYKSRVFGREEKLQGLFEALVARYLEQFPNILVNKDDVLLFAIFGIVRISKSTLSYLVFDSVANFFMIPIPVTTSYLYVWDSEKSFEIVALSSYPVKTEALQLQGCSTCPNKASLGMLLLWNVDFGLAPVSKYFFSNDTHTFTHKRVVPWVLRVYFICGACYCHCKFDGIYTKILFIPCQMFTTSLILDLLTSNVDYFYVSGDVEPHVSSISFLVSTLLVLTVGLSERNCIVYSIKAIVFLNNGIRIFDIGEGNDMPARKSMDEKMGVSHVLHLSYRSVITPLPYGIETEKHVFFYESDSLSSLSLIYLNLEDKVRIQEGSIVMNGPRPIWAEQPNTKFRDYVWDPG
ncbi:hypothetical protein KY289_001255 [Solanum tuberosum]|nr:hypothetical protein KY289_001255 [Solanum tuberosum]